MRSKLAWTWGCLLRDRRGVSSIEYALLLFAILIAVAGGYRALGGKNAGAAKTSTAVLMGGDGTGAAGGGGYNGTGGNGSNTGGSSGTPTGTVCDGRSCGSDGNCFVAGTPVATPSGERPIESLVAGDLVLSRSESDSAVRARPVVRTFVRAAPSLVDVRLATVDGARESLRSTPEHPYWTQNRGWVPAGDLLANETLLDQAGREVRVTKVVAIAQQAQVYNVEVADDHTYFVGHDAVWTHNTCGTGDPGGTGTGTGTGTTGPVTGPVSNPSGLSDAQEHAHIEKFKNGGSFLVPEGAYKSFIEGKPSVGRPDGLFITTKGTVDKILKDANGDVNIINQKLGTNFPPGAKIIRIDVPKPLEHGPRLPTGKEDGANEHFKPGGYTSGGIPEIVVNPVPSGDIKVTPITVK